ncbi:hypothetical protein JCM19237_238 [Photobacterium aphoticum]|uniref:Uncharacterized protein n=1 Tax=Photobacterium aphoticum TaxID=754436 RepID=A0A090R008_9GAMM|nr:hypothetical protein JCM19237_238 [Photobacterium aphoticum]
MITDVQLPTPDALQPLIDEALEGGALTKSDFVTNHCVGIITALVENPLAYRAYGAYWWPVKDILIRNGFTELFTLDDQYEPITAKHFYIEDDATTLCAAWAYFDFMVETGNMLSNIHVYEDADGEQFEYGLEDLDLERYRFD